MFMSALVKREAKEAYSAESLSNDIGNLSSRLQNLPSCILDKSALDRAGNSVFHRSSKSLV